MIHMNLFTNRNRSQIQKRKMVTKGTMWEDKLRVWDSYIHTTMYNIDKQQWPIV